MLPKFVFQNKIFFLSLKMFISGLNFLIGIILNDYPSSLDFLWTWCWNSSVLYTKSVCSKSMCFSKKEATWTTDYRIYLVKSKNKQTKYTHKKKQTTTTTQCYRAGSITLLFMAHNLLSVLLILPDIHYEKSLELNFSFLQSLMKETVPSIFPSLKAMIWS